MILRQCEFVLNSAFDFDKKLLAYKHHLLDRPYGCARSLPTNIGIKHGFLCINICWGPREMLKPEPERNVAFILSYAIIIPHTNSHVKLP